jgi:anti-anti-sigma factor
MSAGILLVSVDGEVDVSNARDLGRAISERITNEALGVVLDLTEVSYMDSAGVHVVFELRERLKTRGQGLRLVVPERSPISSVVQLVDLPRAVGVLETSEEAVAAIAAAVPQPNPPDGH